MPNLLIVGKNSFVGGYIYQRAIQSGLNASAISSKDCDFSDASAVQLLFRQLPATPHIVIFAAVINKTVENSFESFQQNARLVQNLVRAQSEANVRSIVYFSSIDVYGREPQPPITERNPINPDTWYGLAKHNCEWILRMSRQVNCPVSILRLPGIYGNVSNDRSVVGQLVRSIRTTGRASIRGSGMSRRDYVYIEDLFRVVQFLIQRPYAGVLNVVTGKSHTIVDLAHLAAEALDVSPAVHHEPADEAREFDLVFDNALLRSVIPDFTFTDIRAALASYRN